MALYPPIIDTSSTIQTGSGPFTVNYSLEGNSTPTHIAITAVHPRTGASVLTTSSATTTIINSYDVAVTMEDNKPIPIQVYIHQDTNIAQITLQGKIKNGDETTQSSIPSKAVIFKRFNENLTLSFIGDRVISSSSYYLRAQLNIEGANDELAWYKITLKSGSNILLQTDKLYPKARNRIEEYINYDFWFHINPAFTFDIEVGTRNGIVRTFNSNGSWTLNSIVSIPSTKKGTVSCSLTASNTLTTIWNSGANKFPASQGYAALLYRQEGLNWILINTQSATVSNEQRSSLTFDFTITHTRAAQYRIVYKNTTLTEVQNVSDIFWYSAYGEDILLKDSTGSYLIKYNPELNSVKRNIADVITPTLGAKYPFVYRNGH